MSIPFNIAVDADGNSTATLVLPDGVLTIKGPDADGTGGHPNYRRITTALNNDEDVTPFLSVTGNVALSDERVTIDGSTVYFNGQAVHNNLTNTIIRYNAEGRDTTNLVKFMERLDANPSKHSRDQLFTWVNAQDLVIDSDGYLIGYKGVNRQTRTGDDGESLETLVSSRSGPGIVNGEAMTGHLPNDPGNVIELPRRHVTDDPNVPCSSGLHIANYRYAKNWASVLLEVKVDPADVVSVPNDSSGEKMRVCKYEVIGIHEDEADTVADIFEPPADENVVGNVDSLEDAGVPTDWVSRLASRFRRR